MRDQNRKTTGARMTYFSADERYVVTGAPVTIVDQCGRDTTGTTLTFYKAADRIVVDGNEQVRTQTKGANCRRRMSLTGRNGFESWRLHCRRTLLAHPRPACCGRSFLPVPCPPFIPSI